LFTYATVKPAVLQIEHHPYLVQQNLLTLAKEHGIAVTAYSSFGPQSFIECDMKLAADTPLLFDHPVINKAAEKHGKTPAQVLLRWATQRGVSVIPKSNSQGRLQQNLDVTSFDLTKEEIEEISGLDKNLRFNAPTNVSLPFFFENSASADMFCSTASLYTTLLRYVTLFVDSAGLDIDIA
jgi:D-xylose reductase